MSLLELPRKMFMSLGGRVAIFLVGRRLKKKQSRNDPTVWLLLAKLHLTLGNNNQAIQTLENALEHCPGSSQIQRSLRRVQQGGTI